MRILKKKCSKDLISGIPIHSCSKIVVLQEIDESIQKRSANEYISITNTESMYYALRNKDHFEYIKNASFSLCDGIGVVIGAKAQGKKIKRYHGPDLMIDACEYGQQRNWRHFFCGGKEGVAEILVDNLKSRFPDMQVAGIFCPPFREISLKEDIEMIQFIKKSKPDIIWVGLGLLKQERWIKKHLDELNIPWSVGVGAAFDFYAGTVKRAPKVFQKTGLEWLYRMTKEPRMFQRIINSYIFMLQSVNDGIKIVLKKNL